jgi:hypothetical protein
MLRPLYPVEIALEANSIGGCVSSKISLDEVEKINISCTGRELNPDS